MSRWALPGLGALAALAIGLPLALRPLPALDLMFNLAEARFLLAHGFPAQDPFSLTATAPWFPHEWLYGLAAEGALRALGGGGPGWLAGLALALGALLLWRLVVEAYGRGGLVPLGLALLALGAQAFTWEDLRAYQLGNLAFLAAVWIAQKARHGPLTWGWLLLPLSTLAANLHSSWLAGPVLLGAVALGERLAGAWSTRRLLRAWGLAGLAVLAAALSPEGFHTCVYPLRFLVESRGQGILEWSALHLGSPSSRALLLLLGVWLVAWSRGPARPVGLLLPGAGLALVALLAQRFGPLAAVLLAVGAAEMLAAQRPPALPQGPARALARLDGWLLAWERRAGGALWVPLGFAALALALAARPAPLEERLDPDTFPLESLRALAELPPGRVLASYHLGGAVSCLCGPAYKVFIDGRNDPYPPGVHAAYRRLALLEPGWQEDLAAYGPRYVLWSKIDDRTALLEGLRLAGGFRPLVDEASGALWVRQEEP
jgi:hypothetical protein